MGAMWCRENEIIIIKKIKGANKLIVEKGGGRWGK